MNGFYIFFKMGTVWDGVGGANICYHQPVCVVEDDLDTLLSKLSPEDLFDIATCADSGKDSVPYWVTRWCVDNCACTGCIRRKSDWFLSAERRPWWAYCKRG